MRLIKACTHAYADNPNGIMRLTYVKLENKTVTALVMFALADRIEGDPCFNIGYAVPEAYRNQGRAKEIIGKAIGEMQNEFCRHGDATFYVEAVVGTDNKPSQRVAEQVISATPDTITDHFSGQSALHYLLKVAG
jgi:RimJ/RimL family protein N-acetyltransferase